MHNRLIHVVKMRREVMTFNKIWQVWRNDFRYLDRVFNEYDSFIEQKGHKKLEDLIKKM